MRTTTRSIRLRAGIAAAGLLAAGAAAAAQAATPAEGTVSPAAPKVTWEGTLISSGIFYNAWDRDPSIECQAPTCDPFALTLEGTPETMTIGLNVQNETATGGEGGGGLRVVKPDGSIEWVKGTSGPKTTLRLKLKNPKPGAYEVTSVASYVCCNQAAYKAFAEIPAAAPAPAPGPAPAPQPAPQPAGDQAPPSLTVTAPKASARALKRSRKLRIKVGTDGELKSVKAVLTKGRSRIATGALATLTGTKPLTLKLSSKAARRLKAGTYGLSVSGTDAQGRTVGSAIKLKLRK